MRRPYVCIPAVRLSDGTLFQGEPHVILALRAIDLGLSGEAVGGHIDGRGLFLPVYEPPEHVLTFKILTKEYGLKLAASGSHRMRWAIGKLIDTGRDDQEGLMAYADRFDSFCNIGIIPAIRNSITGEIFAGVEMHGELTARHPELAVSAPDCIADGSIRPTPVEVGWSTIDMNQFLTRDQANDYSKNVTGFATSRRLISGEEWFSNLKTMEDAEYLGNHWHTHGYSHSMSRVKVFESKGIHPEYVELLKHAQSIYTTRKKINKRKR